jgi:PTS system cellobiose-specific IIC component
VFFVSFVFFVLTVGPFSVTSPVLLFSCEILIRPGVTREGMLRFLTKHVVPALTTLSENMYLSAVRAGMVAVVPLTIIGGLFMIVACCSIAYELGKQLKQEATVSALMATVIFLMLQIDVNDQAFVMDRLGSKGLFTAILIAVVTVCVQKFFTDRNLVIKLPASVPTVVYDSFLAAERQRMKAESNATS